MDLLLMFLMILIVLHLNLNKKYLIQTGNDGTKDDQIMVPLIWYVSSNFWRTLEMSLINCDISIFSSCSEECIIV